MPYRKICISLRYQQSIRFHNQFGKRMLFLFATLFHPSDVERSLVTSGKLLNRGMRRFNFPMKIISKNRGDFK